MSASRRATGSARCSIDPSIIRTRPEVTRMRLSPAALRGTRISTTHDDIIGTPIVKPGLLDRRVVLIAMLLAEALILGQRFNSARFRGDGLWWGGVIPWAGWIARPAIAALMATVLIVATWLRHQVRQTTGQTEWVGQTWPMLLAHVGAFAGFLRLTAIVMEGNIQASPHPGGWVIAWAAMGARDVPPVGCGGDPAPTLVAAGMRELAHDQQHLAAQFRIERATSPRRTAAPWATWRARGRSPRAAAGRPTGAPDRRRACRRDRPSPAASRPWRRPRSRGIFFTRSGASIRFSSTDMCGHRLKCWNTMPMSERTARAAALIGWSGSGVEIAVPSMTMRPSLGVSSRARQRSSVVLPEPLGPTTHTTSRSITGRRDARQHLVLAESLADVLRLDDRRSRHRSPSTRAYPSAQHKQFLCLSTIACPKSAEYFARSCAMLTLKRSIKERYSVDGRQACSKRSAPSSTTAR